jgi:putative chitinase
MVILTIELLRAIAPMSSEALRVKYLHGLQATLVKYDINANPLRVAHFFAQIIHESGSFKYVRELASGADYDTGKKAASLGNTPEADGDGQKFKGRGFIQITGKANYLAVGKALQKDFITHPEELESPDFAALSAGWYWDTRKLNAFADKDDVLTITKKINGGTNGLEDRKKHLLIAKKALGI